MNKTLNNVRKRIKEYNDISKKIKSIKNNKDYYILKEKLYEDLDNTYYDELRLKYKNHTKKEMKQVKKKQKVITSRIKRLSKHYNNIKKNDY